MERSALVIKSLSDLASLNPYHRRDKDAKRRHSEIKLQLADLTPAEIAAREKRINRLYFDCGCSEATAFGLAALVGVGAWLFFRPGGLSAFSPVDAVYFIVGFLLASGLGKWVGRLRARRALQVEVDGLRTYLGAEAKPSHISHAKCGIS